MLSATNTINDVKVKLMNDYAYYGYATDNAFTTFLTAVADEIKLSDIYPLIGSEYYANIEAKDKVNLSEEEQYIYWGEVFLICAAFLGYMAQKTQQSVSGDSESVSSEGYSKSVTGGTRTIGYNDACWSFWSKAVDSFNISGYSMSIRMKRGGEFFSDDFLRRYER